MQNKDPLKSIQYFKRNARGIIHELEYSKEVFILTEHWRETAVIQHITTYHAEQKKYKEMENELNKIKAFLYDNHNILKIE